MNNNFEVVKAYILKLRYDITHEDQKEGILMIENKSKGIKNLIIGVTAPILIIEQYLFDVINVNDERIFYKLLLKNRDIVHGAFVLDNSGEKVIFRDTLQIENLDLNELEGSLNSLSLLLSEYSEQIHQFSKK